MDVNSKIEYLFEQFWRWRIETSPEFGTFCGFHKHDDKLETYTPEDMINRQEMCQKFLKEGKMLIQQPGINVKNQENLKILMSDIEIYLKGMEFKMYCFPISYLDGPHLEFERLCKAMKLETPEDYQNLIKRYRALPTQLSEMRTLMKWSIEENRKFHSVSVASVPDQISQLLKDEDKIKNTVFFKPFLQLDDSEEKNQCILQEITEVISNEIIPAFKDLKEIFCSFIIPNASCNPSIHNTPYKEALYGACLDFHLETHLTPKEVHEMGLSEVSRITGEIEKVIESLGHKNMSVKEFAECLSADDSFYCQSPEEVLETFTNIVFEKISPKLKLVFKDIPDSMLNVEPFPPAMAGGPSAYYLAGTPDGSRPGVFYANTTDLRSLPKYEMMSLALHEALPGHHLQQCYLFSYELPLFRQFIEDRKYSEAPSRFPLHSAYIEGWGLYSEYLGSELGLYEDKYDYFGYLSQELFRAARLVVDTGIHALGWSIEDSVAYMVAMTAHSKGDIEREIKRYVTWPGQACAYKVGEMKIKSLRQKAERSLGAKFNIQDFHKVVLSSCGPLNMLEEKIHEFIKMCQDS